MFSNLNLQFKLQSGKLDSIGSFQWEKIIGGSKSDVLYSIQQTLDGGYICGGTSISDSTGDKTENSIGQNGQYDYWIIKLNNSGNIQWQNTIGGSGADELQSIKQTTDGGYICGGYSLSSISGDKTENSQGLHDYWVVKLDNSGNSQWQNTIGGNSLDYLQCIQQTSDYGYICGGFSRSDSSVDKTEHHQGGFLLTDDYWVVKLIPDSLLLSIESLNFCFRKLSLLVFSNNLLTK